MHCILLVHVPMYLVPWTCGRRTDCSVTVDPCKESLEAKVERASMHDSLDNLIMSYLTAAIKFFFKKA